jgi:N-acetylmuramic acid 6-phosphate etherase
MLRRINDEDATVAAAVRTQLHQIARAVDAAAEALRGGGRLIYVGAGTSGRLGVLDAAECLPTFGVSPEQVFGIIAGGERALIRAVEGAEDDRPAGEAAVDAANVGPRDVLVCISASGGAPYVRGAAARGKARGAVTVGIANTPHALLSEDVDIAVEVVTGPEVIAGSTRLKAGTAQKMVLNMISTGAMVRAGKTYGNRMVDVQAANSKLVGRARRLLREIGRVETDERASELLAAAAGSVKRGIVMARRGVGAAEADELLRAADGFLSVVIGDKG